MSRPSSAVCGYWSLKLTLKFAKSKQAAMSVVLVAIVSVWLVLVTSAAAQPGRDVTEPGRTVFFSQGCYGCHRVGVAGTPIANDLSHVGRKYTDAEIAQWLRDPASQKPTAHMPRLALTEDEIRALAAYLGALR